MWRGDLRDINNSLQAISLTAPNILIAYVKWLNVNVCRGIEFPDFL